MKHGAKMAFDCLKLAQDGRKLDPRWPKIGPRRGQKGDNAKLYVEGSYQPPFRTVLQGAAEDARKTSWSEYALGPSEACRPSPGAAWGRSGGLGRGPLLGHTNPPPIVGFCVTPTGGQGGAELP